MFDENDCVNRWTNLYVCPSICWQEWRGIESLQSRGTSHILMVLHEIAHLLSWKLRGCSWKCICLGIFMSIMPCLMRSIGLHTMVCCIINCNICTFSHFWANLVCAMKWRFLDLVNVSIDKYIDYAFSLIVHWNFFIV